MKMTEAQYNEWKGDIRTVGNSLGILKSVQYSPQGVTGLKHMYLLARIVDENRIHDDAWFEAAGRVRVLPHLGRKYYGMYHTGLDDSHIATALKKIRKELLAETE